MCGEIILAMNSQDSKRDLQHRGYEKGPWVSGSEGQGSTGALAGLAHRMSVQCVIYTH